MPTIRIPLVGTFNQRGLDGTNALELNQDQRFLNTVFSVAQNPVTGKATVYVERRPGWGVESLVSSGIASTGMVKPQLFNAPLSAFGDTNSNLYVGTVNVGVITGRALHLTETLVSNTSHVLVRSSDGTGWYYVDGAKDVLTYTGATSAGSATVSTISSTIGIYPGQAITGNVIPAGTRVSTVNFATSTITLNANATSTSTSVALTKEPIAKILSANFDTSGTYISAFAPLDGYHFYATTDGYVKNSDLNSAVAYQTNSKLAVQQSPDQTIGVAVQRNALIAFGLASKEVFQNAGLASGSPLQRVAQAFDRVGAIDQRSITSIENEIYFIGTPYEGDLGVYRIRDIQAQRISTPWVDKILGTISATNGAIYASSFKLGGYSYASFYCSLAADGPASDLLLESGDALLLESGDRLLLEDTPASTASFVRLLVYNIGLNIWHEWDCNQATFIDSVGSGTANQLLATSRANTSGKIYSINPVAQGELYQDDTSTYSMEIRTAKIDLGSNDRKYIEEVGLIADTVTTTATTVSLYWSDDDYKTWKGPLTFDLSQAKKNVHRLGAHYDGRAYKLVHQANGPFRAQALEIKYREGRS